MTAVLEVAYTSLSTAREKLTVKSTGRIIGTVRCGQLEVELGGSIRGDTAPLDEPIAEVKDVKDLKDLKDTGTE